MYPLTQYLNQVFRGQPLVLVDIGARWGISKQWEAFGESLRAFCFEPDKEECDRLNGQCQSNIKFIPEAIGASNGMATLYDTRFNASSGLYKVNDKFFGRLMNRDNATVLNTRQVRLKTFDLVREEYEIPEPDFIKLDVEGAELEILKATDLSSTFGFFTEFRFHREINGSPPFYELDNYARSQGFMLYDIQVGRQSRKTLPYPGPRMNWNTGERFYASTVRGQVMDGDALYLRDPMLFKMERTQLLKAACLFEVWLSGKSSLPPFARRARSGS